jgi:hypothetical protein
MCYRLVSPQIKGMDVPDTTLDGHWQKFETGYKKKFGEKCFGTSAVQGYFMRFRDDPEGVSSPSNWHHLAESGVFAEQENTKAKENAAVETTPAAKELWEFLRQHKGQLSQVELGEPSEQQFVRENGEEMIRIASLLKAEEEDWAQIKQRQAIDADGASAPGGEALAISAIRDRWSATQSNSVASVWQATTSSLGMGRPALTRRASGMIDIAPAVSRTRSV